MTDKLNKIFLTITLVFAALAIIGVGGAIGAGLTKALAAVFFILFLMGKIFGKEE